MRYVLAFLFMSMLALAAVACDAITANTPLGGQCHNRADGSVLKAVEDANGKRWPVVKYPITFEVFGIIIDYCAVSLEAKESAYQEPTRVYLQVGPGGKTREYTYDDPSRDHWFIHPGTNERIEIGVLGPYRGYLDLNTEYEWY